MDPVNQTENMNDITTTLAGLTLTLKADPNADARRMAYIASEAARKAETLWRDANAPERHYHAKAEASGDWGRTLAALRAKLGSGLFAALNSKINGSGKTQMGVELMRHQINTLGRPAVFLSATEFFIQVKATYRSDASKSEADVLTKYAKPELLVIDEIEKRGASEWENILLFHLFNRRYNAVKDTLLISNLPEAELCQHLGPALVSRLNETGGLISCDWPSRREA